MTGLILPTSLPAGGTTWGLADYRRVTLTSPPAAGGSNPTTATGPQLDNGELWLIDRAVSFCDSITPTALRFYESAATPARLLSGTASGNFDEAEYPGGLLVQSGGQLLAVWTGAATGAVGVCNVQVRILRAG